MRIRFTDVSNGKIFYKTSNPEDVIVEKTHVTIHSPHHDKLRYRYTSKSESWAGTADETQELLVDFWVVVERDDS